MRNTTPSSTKFEQFFEDPLYLLYKNHLYNFLVRRWVIRRKLRQKSFGKILELGCGISPILKGGRGVIQTDFSWQALSHLNRRSQKEKPGPRISCDATQLPFPDESFDCVICSEVIEHIENDAQAFHEIARVLRPGGELYLTCPMHQKYFGFDDQFVGHYRRYEIEDLKNQLSDRGLSGVKITAVLGPLEKWIMEKVTRIFASRKNGRPKNSLRGTMGPVLRGLAWMGLPFYILLNYMLAQLVYFQAQSVPFDEAVTLCFHCQKQTLN